MSAQTLVEQVLNLESSLSKLEQPLQAMLDEPRFLRCARLRLRCSSAANRIVVARAAGTMPDVPDTMPAAFSDAAGKAAAAAALGTTDAADHAMDLAAKALATVEALVPVADGSAARGIA